MSNYKRKVTHLKERLGSLLSQKKVLLSKVVSKEFDKFCLAIQRVVSDESNPSDVKDMLIELEKVLKKEGLFKNVKSGFVNFKKDFLLVLPTIDHSEGTNRGKTAVISKTLPLHHRREHSQLHISQAEDIKNLNKAVGRLFDHLKIHRATEYDEPEGNTARDVPKTRQRNESDDFQELVRKIKEFEQEFQKQKSSQHTELMRLLEENRNLKTKMQDLKRENTRMKGIQPIASKAANKQVEKIEEQFKTQRKGMEGKIQAIEVELQSNLQRTMQEKDVLEQVILEGVSKLKSSITNLQRKMVLGKTTSQRFPDKEKDLESLEELGSAKMENLLQELSSIEKEAMLLQKRNEDLQRALKQKDTEICELKTSVSEITTEVSKVHESIAAIGPVNPNTSRNHPDDNKSSFISPSDISNCRAQNSEHVTEETESERDAVINKLQQINDTIQQYKRLLHNGRHTPKDSLQPLKRKINRIHDDLMSTMRPGSVAASRAESIISGSVVSHPSLASGSKTDEVNQLLQKLTRVERACTDLLEICHNSNGRIDQDSDYDDP